MISSLEVTNFRGIKSLEIDDFRPLNLFYGENNCGKTSILEALFLTLGMSNPKILFALNQLRNLIFSEADDFRFFFYKLDYNNRISAKLNTAGGLTRSVSISPLDTTLHIQKNIQEVRQGGVNKFDLGLSTQQDLVSGLKFAFSLRKNGRKTQKDYSLEITFENGELKVKPSKNYKEELIAVFLSTGTAHVGLPDRLDKVLQRKLKTRLLKPLQKLEPLLQDITLGSNGMIYVDLGESFDRLLPLNILGDGAVRLLSILTAIVYNKNSVILIDEIENGFHYSSLEELWKSILLTAKENAVQVFATSHSSEALAHLTNVLSQPDFRDFKDDVHSYTIRKLRRDLVKAYPYDFQQIEHLFEHGVEVR